MTDLEYVKQTHMKLCANAYDMIEKKGADYNRQQQNGGDTLYNLTVSTVLGITDTTTQSILVRISDKIMRLVSLTKNPDTISEVKDESVQDTIEDTINYLVYLYCKYEEANKT